MKLLITLDFPPHIGGIQKYLYGIVRFRYSEHDHVFVAGVPYASPKHRDIKATVKHFSSPTDWINRKISLLLLILPYLLLCKRYRNSLTVECGNIYAAFIPWLLFSITRQPYGIYTYGTEIIALKKKSLKNTLLKKILLKANKLYTLGKYSEKILRKLTMVHPIDIIPPRITLTSHSQVLTKRNKDPFTILSVGRLVEHKGHANLIRAAAMLSHEKKYAFVIVGDGPYYKSLKKMCVALDVNDSVSIKRNLSDELLHEECNNANIFVLPSIETPEGTEGFGIVLLEAMAHYLPIVACATGGIPEVLDNGNCGLLVEADNVDALVHAIQKMANNSSLAVTFAQKAHERLMASYVWK